MKRHSPVEFVDGEFGVVVRIGDEDANVGNNDDNEEMGGGTIGSDNGEGEVAVEGEDSGEDGDEGRGNSKMSTIFEYPLLFRPPAKNILF
jgi:hypothetical protein